jgi:hypothetical protein
MGGIGGGGLMTANTTTWNIPYATGADPWCNGPAILASMAASIDTLVTTFASDLARIQIPPYASIETLTTTSTTLDVNSVAPVVLTATMTTVDADTGNYSNLSVDPTSITIPATRPGYYLGIAYTEGIHNFAQGTTSGISTTLMVQAVNPSNVPLPDNNVYQTRSGGNISVASSAVFMLNADATTGTLQYQVAMIDVSSSTITDKLTMRRAFVAMLWVADE